MAPPPAYEPVGSRTPAALFLAGWSPLLWTYAASVLAPLEGQDCSLEGRFRKWGGSLSPLAGLTRPSDTRREGGGAASASLDVAVIEPDTPGAGDAPGAGAGRLQRTVEVQLVTRDAGKGEASSGAVSGSEGRGEGVGLRNGYRQTLAAGDGEAGPGPGGSRSGSLAPARWTGRVAEAVGGVMTPPLWGILAGTLVGLSPLGPALVGPASALQGLPWEARGALHVLRAVFDVVAMLGAATLPVQAVVLAASLAQPGGSTGVTRARIMPSEPSERRAMVAIGIVRAFLVPMAGEWAQLECSWGPWTRQCSAKHSVCPALCRFGDLLPRTAMASKGPRLPLGDPPAGGDAVGAELGVADAAQALHAAPGAEARPAAASPLPSLGVARGRMGGPILCDRRRDAVKWTRMAPSDNEKKNLTLSRGSKRAAGSGGRISREASKAYAMDGFRPWARCPVDARRPVFPAG